MNRNPLVAAIAAASTLAAASAHSAVSVVATTSSMGMLARTVGGDAVKVTVLSPPDREAHHVLAKPSMMVALRRADLLVAVGAELEVGWLPAALQGASNPRILPGQPGYFEGAAQVDLIETGQSADRSRGDVHPMGNPHYYMDPERMARVARALGVPEHPAWPANERRAFAQLSLLMALVPDLDRWPAADRRRLVQVLRAKGGPSEARYVRLLDGHRRPRRSLEGLLAASSGAGQDVRHRRHRHTLAHGRALLAAEPRERETSG